MYASADAPGPTGLANHRPDRMMTLKVQTDRLRRPVLLDDLTAGVFDDFLVADGLAPVRLWTRPPVRQLFMVR